MEDILSKIQKRQDDGGDWYWIPNELVGQFDADLEKIIGKEYMDCPTDFENFSLKYEMYMTGGDPDVVPSYFEKQEDVQKEIDTGIDKDATLDDEAIRATIIGFFDGLDQSSRELYDRVIEGIDFSHVDTPSCFDTLVSYPMREVLGQLAKERFGNSSQTEFILVNYEYIESQFTHWVVEFEGSVCSADKVGDIINRLINFYNTGEEIVWDYTAEYTFHMPKKVFTNHRDIVGFFEAIHSMYSGSPDKYLIYMRDCIAPLYG